MDYFLSFIEGIITFISPCLLPVLPIYISYFAGRNKKPLMGSLGFSLGFTLVFVMLGAFAGSVGWFLTQYVTAVNIVSGLIMILFGLNFMGVLDIGFLNMTRKLDVPIDHTGFFSSMVFGIVFSIGWTPCVGAFLGSALMLAASSGSVGKGVLMLLCYSLGLGIPFVLSAFLIDKLKDAFDFITRNYRVVNMVSGSLLIVVGILMATGTMGTLLSLLS